MQRVMVDYYEKILDKTNKMTTVWTQIRLLLEEQSDLSPHCLPQKHFKEPADNTQQSKR